MRPLTDDRATGRTIEAAFLPEGGLVVRRTIPEAAMQALVAQNAAAVETQPRGSMLGHTQRHRLRIASLPKPIYDQLVRRLGPLRENEAAWMRWLRDPDNRAFLTSGYRP